MDEEVAIKKEYLKQIFEYLHGCQCPSRSQRMHVNQLIVMLQTAKDLGNPKKPPAKKTSNK